MLFSHFRFKRRVQCCSQGSKSYSALAVWPFFYYCTCSYEWSEKPFFFLKKKKAVSQAGATGSTTALVYFWLSSRVYGFCTESNSDSRNFISLSNLTSQILVFPERSQIRSRHHKYYMFSWGNPLFLFHGLVLEPQIRCRNPRVFFAISSNPSNSVLEEVANKSNSFFLMSFCVIWNYFLVSDFIRFSVSASFVFI